LAGETVNWKARASHLYNIGSGGLAEKTKQKDPALATSRTE